MKNELKEWRNKVVQGDCLELMKQLPDNSIDLVLTDPPYNISSNTKTTKLGNNVLTTKQSFGEWDTFKDNDYFKIINEFLKQSYRILKDTGNLFVFFDRFEITKLKDNAERIGFHPRNVYALIKNNPLPNFRKAGFRSGFELGLHFSKIKKKGTFNFLMQDEMINYYIYNIGIKETAHPTEKPLQPIKRLIRVLSNKNDLVLDSFLGSGTTAVACKQLGRNFIGFELSEDYCKMANKRLSQEVLLDYD